MTDVIERFLRYVAFDTTSKHDQAMIPSTEKQKALGSVLADELRELGIEDARMDEHGYVYASIPGNIPGAPAIGFIAHMDTSPDACGEGVTPRIVMDYDGGDIELNEELILSPKEFPALKRYTGQDIIVTDGTTLLGADDKAGIAEIMTLAETIMNYPALPHGRICIAFTPDEEVGNGAELFDVKAFGADFAYTVDGGELGELEYENFNAASAKVRIKGSEIHPGSAKGMMINAQRVAIEFDMLLPPAQRPEHTEGYEGFFHLCDMKGNVACADLNYIIRDHDKNAFEQKKGLLRKAADYLNAKYEKELVQVEIRDSYYNMKEKILPHMHLIDIASAAMEDCGVTPIITPVRGGTDGARLSYMGLPCPNLSTGGHNFHGRKEYIPAQSLEKMCRVLLQIVERVSELNT